MWCNNATAPQICLDRLLFLTGERFHNKHELYWIVVVLLLVTAAWLMSKNH